MASAGLPEQRDSLQAPGFISSRKEINMMGRKSLIGIAVLCALAFSAFAAANASAAQRAVTCSTESGLTKTFGDAHCIAAGSTHGHKAIPDNTTTTITGTNEKTANGTTAKTTAKLRGQLAGVVTEVQCTGMHGHGTLLNRTTPANHVEGEGTIDFTNCSVTAPGGGCGVGGGGAFTTRNLFATTASRAAGLVYFQPKTGVTLAEIPIAGCAGEKPPKNTYLVTGAVIGQVSGATITTTHNQTTLDGELEFGGVEAGLEGAWTISMAEGSTPNVTAGAAIALT